MSEYPYEPTEEWPVEDLGRAAKVSPNPLRREAVNELIRRLRSTEDAGEEVEGG